MKKKNKLRIWNKKKKLKFVVVNFIIVENALLLLSFVKEND